MKRFFALALLLALAACTPLPGQDGPLEIGPLHFELTIAQLREEFADSDVTLDVYDTMLGQTWSVPDPFQGREAQPAWLTEGAERVTLTFWNDKLLRIRVHLPTTNLAVAEDLRRRFNKGYGFVADLSRGERVFLEWETDALKIFLAGGGDQSTTVTFVDRAAFAAMDASRARLVAKAAANFELDGLRWGMTLSAVREVLGAPSGESDFFAGLDGRRWDDPAHERQWILGFAPTWGLAAIARLHTREWPAQRFRERLLELTRTFGHGDFAYNPDGYSLTITADNLTITLLATGCEQGQCQVSEGWLWAGPKD